MSYEVRTTPTGVAIDGLADFNLVDIFESGQCFRYYKVDDKYRLITNGQISELWFENDTLMVDNITVDDFVDYYENYFDLNTDYRLILNTLRNNDPQFAEYIPSESGLRILRQDILETIISFIISSNNNIPRIKLIINNICSLKGEPIEYDNVTYYKFPTIDALHSMSISDFKYCGAGYRARYLADTITVLHKLSHQYGSLEEFFDGLNYNAIMRALKSLSGVGDKVANCIALFAFHQTQAFPIDTWIEKALYRVYLLPTNRGIQYLQQFAQDRYGVLGGYAQQYLFYYLRGKIRWTK